MRDWCNWRNVPALILRIPLVYGPYFPGNLVAIGAMIQRVRYVRINGNTARKSVFLAEDIAQLIVRIDGKWGTYNLTDGQHSRFSDLEETIAKVHEQPIWFGLPRSLLKFGAYGGDMLKILKLPTPLYTARLNNMTASLLFDDHAARRDFRWQPQSVLSKAARILPKS